jgi:hypothetical protein
LFADRRVERSEWFNVPPQAAIDALIEIAQHYPVGPTPTSQVNRHDVLPGLRERHGRDIDPHITVATLEDDGSVISLRTVTSEGIERVEELGFIVDGDTGTPEEEPSLTPTRTLEANAFKFLDFDIFTLLVCTTLVNPERAEAIDREFNPYYKQPEVKQDSGDVPF